jgi:hypothetical protein
VQNQRPKAKAKAKVSLAAGAKAKGYGAGSGSRGCVGGKGALGEDAPVGNRHYKMRVARINLGGWRKRIRYAYEWNMWNMPADLVLCCEMDVLTY